MKNGNWMPIDTRLAVFLPKDREYTELEAMYSLQLNYDRGDTVTVAGLAASWRWKRHAVYALLKKVGALVVYQGKRKSRSTGGILVPVKGACQAHVGDMSCSCRAHVRLIKNNKLDDKRCISIPSQSHDNNMWATLLSIPHTTYSYKEKEGEGNDNLQHANFGFNGDPVFFHSYKSLKRGYRENDSTVSAAGNRESEEVFYGGNGNADSRIDPRLSDGTNLNWSDLDGKHNNRYQQGDVLPVLHFEFSYNDNVGNSSGNGKSLTAVQYDMLSGRSGGRHGLDNIGRNNLGVSYGANIIIPGQGPNSDLFDVDNPGSVGNSGIVGRVDGETTMGKESTKVDREEVGNDDLETKAEDPPEPPPKAKEKNGIPYQAIVEILNEHTGKNFRHTTKQTQSLIKARWRDGYTIDDFRRVIAGRVEKWIGDPKMCEYLRPSTLFGSKFESYLQAESTVKKITLPKTNNKINCKEFANVGSCRNAEDNPIASCALYTPQGGLVATNHANEGNNAKAKTVSQMMILENDAIAKALLEDRRRREAITDGEV